MAVFIGGKPRDKLYAVRHVAHLPLMVRLRHLAVRRMLINFVGGITVMVMGVYTAKLGDHYHDYHITLDTLGYFLHGVGAVPILKYLEPMWFLLMGITPVE